MYLVTDARRPHTDPSHQFGASLPFTSILSCCIPRLSCSPKALSIHPARAHRIFITLTHNSPHEALSGTYTTSLPSHQTARSLSARILNPFTGSSIISYKSSLRKNEMPPAIDHPQVQGVPHFRYSN